MSELPVHFAGEALQQRILVLRGERVMIDSDLAELYGVTTKRFNEQVKRNLERFPVGFMFQLTAEEKAEVVAKCDHLARLKFSPHRNTLSTLVATIRQMATPPTTPSRQIGFVADPQEKKQ